MKECKSVLVSSDLPPGRCMLLEEETSVSLVMCNTPWLLVNTVSQLKKPNQNQTAAATFAHRDRSALAQKEVFTLRVVIQTLHGFVL